jgi:hypothetical protein
MPSAGKHRNNHSTSVLRVPNQHSQSVYARRFTRALTIQRTGRDTMNRRSILSISAMTVLGLALVPSSAVSQQKSLKEQIQGPWSLASCNSTNAKGEKTVSCASNNTRGILILAGNGNYASTTIAGGRKDADAPGVTANFGTWSVNEADKTVTIHFVGALNPTIEGKDLKLSISLNGEELRTTGDLSNIGVQGSKVDTTYRRFK